MLPKATGLVFLAKFSSSELLLHPSFSHLPHYMVIVMFLNFLDPWPSFFSPSKLDLFFPEPLHPLARDDTIPVFQLWLLSCRKACAQFYPQRDCPWRAYLIQCPLYSFFQYSDLFSFEAFIITQHIYFL